MSLSSIEFWRDVDTRLEEGGEFNVEGIWRGKSKRSASSQMQKGEHITFSTFLFLLYDLFFFVVFFFFPSIWQEVNSLLSLCFFFFFSVWKEVSSLLFLHFFLLYGFFFLLFEKKKMLGESTWNERAEVGAKNERAKRKLESKFLPLFAFFFFSMGFFFCVVFFFAWGKENTKRKRLK